MNHHGSQDKNVGVHIFGVDETKLLVRPRDYEGFTVEDVKEIDPSKKSFIDETKKIVIDNSVPYGHFTTIWIYLLLTELKRHGGPATVLLYKNPNTRDLRLEHSSNLMEYLEQRLIEKGHTVKYIDTEEFYVNNFTTFSLVMNINQSQMHVLSEFFSEGLDYSKEPTEKIYLSRAKTTTYNGNQRIPIPHETDLPAHELTEIRSANMYQFSDRIDDEQVLEEYLKTLGFTIVYPEDISSYKDQLQLFASSKIVMSLTSSSLSVCTAMAPNTFLIELVSPMYTMVDNTGALIKESEQFHDTYKSLSLLKNNLYMSISNRYMKAAIIIDSIESNPGLKVLLSS